MASRSDRRDARYERRLPQWREEHVARIARELQRARVGHGRDGGGTPLMESVVALRGSHRANYALYARSGVLIGTAGSMDPTPPHRERVEIHASRAQADWDMFGIARHLGPEYPAVGDRVLSVLIAERFGDVDDAVLDGDDVELVRLQNAWRARGPGEPRVPNVAGSTRARDGDPRQLRRRLQCLGLAPRRVMADNRMIGWVTASRDQLRRPYRLVLDNAGRPAATVTRTVGGTTTEERCYVADLREPVDARLRATALVVSFLWDWYTIAWQAGG